MDVPITAKPSEAVQYQAMNGAITTTGSTQRHRHDARHA